MEVAVVYHRDEESRWADSADVPGFYAVGESLAEVRKLVREGLAFHFDSDEAIEVLERHENHELVWEVTISGVVDWPNSGVVDWPKPGVAQKLSDSTYVEARVIRPRGQGRVMTKSNRELVSP
ncbi:MAG TPA: type II toxin-antitoxin system HicB family antitoxin [Actinomycetaceae bacterium]|nr:type II toxin-antitoxin system HicB family antitoxin [Actinomycetaceae bacterium]